MLGKKMIREIRGNIGQFLSLFILSFLAVSLYACMKASNISAYNKLDDLRSITNCADGWIFSEGFSSEDLSSVRNLSDVTSAQRRLHITATAESHDQAQLEVYVLEENLVSKPYYVSGEKLDLASKDSIWISDSFAKEWDLKIGDSFSFSAYGFTITKKIAGTMVAPEYQYLKADKDLDIILKNIAVIYMPVEGLKESLSAFGAEIPFNELVFTTDRQDVKSMEEDLGKALKGNYAVFCDRDDMPGIRIMKDELTQHDQFAITFPVVFLAIALLVIMTTMNRMIANQRTQIGTLRALGMKRRKIILHYLSYSFFVSLLGSIAGLFVGTYLMGEGLAVIFRAWYLVPGWTVEMDASFLIVVALVVFCCTLATYFSCRKVMNVHPAESLRPSSPKSGKRTLFEKLPFWGKLGFSSQYNLRDISRGKLRAFMGIFGTAAGMMIMVAAMASITTIQDASTWTFDKIQNFKNEIDFSEGITVDQAESYKEQYGGELISASAIEIAKEPQASSDKKRSTSLMVTEGLNNYRLTGLNRELVELEPGTCAITMKLARALDLKEGDTFYWHLYEKNTWYEAKVGLINRHPNFSGVTMLRADYEETGAEYVPTMLYSNATSVDVEGQAGILAVHDDKDLKESFDIMMEMIYAMLIVFVVFAAILPIVVLYNCGNLSFHERIKEFATLKVLGFTTKRIRKLLSLQNLWLSIVGLILGAPFGTVMLQYMFDSNGDSMDYPVSAGFLVYLISALFVMGVSVLVSYMFNKRIRKLDMVDILKGMD
ncbi:MAG: ABC transporter permease [Clostridiales bacterium]|nr:ABC transporter permease [Clostridiales bacterium]